ncbi:MAG: MATE family efflux transporter [Lachnospiraceae bacterium]|nr:MATE family efflux transporter [Lachnospiraceae bacterium]
MKGKTMDMTAGKPAALLLRFSMPLILGNLFQQLYTFVDTVIVGQKLGVSALAALGATEWLSFMMFGFIQGLTQGFSIGISQSFGEGKKHLVQQGIFQAFCASAGAAVIITVIGQGMLVPVLKLLRTPEELFGMAYLYLEILYFGIPVSFAYNMLAAILRAFGNSRAPLIAVLTASFANIFFDIVLVMGLGMGIRGAAYGTLLSQLCSVLCCMAALSRIEQARVEPANRKISVRMFAEQMKLGVPMGLQNIITAVGGLTVQSVVNGFGMLFLAGYTAANRLYGLLETAASSYGYAISTYTAQNIGAGKKERVRSGILTALLLGAATAYLMSFIMVIWGKPILGLFIAGSQVEATAALRVGYRFLCILAAFFPLLYALYILRSCIQGMGNSTMPMLSSLIQVGMRIFCAAVLTRYIGNAGVFWGEIMAWLWADVFLGAVFVYRYRTNLRLK